ncbi:hypothetical protein F5Y16DRAFT_359990 [Xylariaceae sp. FL0255]|nr:hypothetical protein F5Y16DRAFT_359990 [Xylariaceae sp. FL0255]
MTNDQEKPSFLSLPPEIRDQIYTIILHPNNNRTFHPNEHTDYDFRAALVLYRLNRAIYFEARDIFRTLNVFVRIETPWSEAEEHVKITAHVPIVMNRSRATKFDGHHLNVVIKAPQGDALPDGISHFVILADDLEAFTKSWMYSNLSHPGLNQWLTLQIHLRDPTAASWDEPHVRREIQRRLFLPWGHVKGLTHFTVTGDPRPQPKIEAEMRALQNIPHPSPEHCLAECARLKAEGNALLQNGNPKAALAAYNRAWEAIHIIVRGRERHVHAEAFYAKDLTEAPYEGKSGQMERMTLRLRLVANTCQAYLILQDWNELKFWGMRTIHLITDGRPVTNDGPDRPEEMLLGLPFTSQIGKIYYRTAKACKALGELATARRLLRIAAVYRPNDKAIEEELRASALRNG